MTEDQLKKYVTFLTDNNYDACLDDKKLINIEVEISNKKVHLLCEIPETFPYSFPVIYIDCASKRELPSMPHSCTKNVICTFDTGKVIPNFMEPESLIKDTIDRAISNVRDGAMGKNHKDYIDEIFEYWKVKANSGMNSFIEDISSSKGIYVYPGNNTCGCLVDDDRNRLIRIAKNVSSDIVSSNDIVDAVLVTIPISKVTNIPNTDKDIMSLIKNNSDGWVLYYKYMQRNINRKNLVLLSLGGKETVLIGWKHNAFGVPNGFTKGNRNIPLGYAFDINHIPNGKAVSINDCSNRRLFQRGGTGKACKINSASIIGCGSLGGCIAEAIGTLGILKVNLVDNECLSSDNIARHVAGYNYIGLDKVDAIKNLLNNHNPAIDIKAISSDAHILIEKYPEKLNESDIIFVAVGDIGVENHIVQLFNGGCIVKPIVIFWVEPYSFGGHAILIQRSQDLYEELFDKDTLEFKSRIIENPESLFKREFGCQSSYMPYSGFQVKEFIYRVLEEIITSYLDTGNNYLFSWCGRLSDVAKYGLTVSEAYKDCDNYSLIVKRVD